MHNDQKNNIFNIKSEKLLKLLLSQLPDLENPWFHLGKTMIFSKTTFADKFVKKAMNGSFCLPKYSKNLPLELLGRHFGLPGASFSSFFVLPLLRLPVVQCHVLCVPLAPRPSLLHAGSLLGGRFWSAAPVRYQKMRENKKRQDNDKQHTEAL